jgi:hypothetical protein
MWVGGTGWRPCPVVGFYIIGVELLDFTVRELVLTKRL